MTEFNDIYYTASLIEYVGRATLNQRSVIANILGEDGIARLLKLANVNHCLSFEQVSDELIARYNIPKGNFDTVSICRYKVPSYKAIGKVYARLAVDVQEEYPSYAAALFAIFTSGIAEKISNFNSSFFFAPRTEVAYNYRTFFM